MSKEAIKDLWKAAAQDGKLKERLEQSREMHEFLAIAAEHGHSFTSEELLESIRPTPEDEPEELTDEQLERVAGGLPIATGGPALQLNLNLMASKGWMKKWWMFEDDL